MMITKCQVLRPESRGPGAGTRDSVNILEITESQLPSSSCQDSGLPAPGSQELGLSDLQYVHLSEINKCAGNPESQQPELGSRESVNILEITESQVPSPGSQNLGVGDLQNVNILEITNSRLPSSGCRDSGSPAPDTQDSVNILEITDSQLPTPGCRQPRVLAAGTQELGVTTW
ncbi:hypothetical protein F4604DRAFT_1676847 [Suillus subluteus]|nr:hypothetical protein F4604DRAFT_1676847 [Suillus subluteus]